ncbi:MAG: hypothetical protein ACRD13_03480, partial [Terriglobales bacterium]
MAHRRAWKIHIRFPDQPDAIERALEGNSVFIGWGRCGQPLLAERRRHPADGSKPSPKFKSLLHRVYYAEDAGRRRSGQAAPSAWN